MRRLGLVGDREPVVAGQSWGGNVVLTLAAAHGGVAGLALVDGGWIWLGDRFPTFERVLGRAGAAGSRQGCRWPSSRPGSATSTADFPPRAPMRAGQPAEDADGHAVARLTREHHKQILHSLWADDPRPLFPKVTVPTLVAAVAEGRDGAGRARAGGRRHPGRHHLAVRRRATTTCTPSTRTA